MLVDSADIRIYSFVAGSNRKTASAYQLLREVQKLFDVNGVGSNLSFLVFLIGLI